MATYRQINTVLNKLMSQYRGGAGDPVDLTSLISLGRDNVSTNNFKDAFNGSLSDVIGKTVVRYLKSALEFPELSRNEFEFGGMLRKIRISPMSMVENTSVKIGGDGYTPAPYAVTKPVFGEKFFPDFDSWAEKCTVPDTLLNTAFHNGEELGAFLDALMDSIGDTFTAHENLMAKTCVTNWILEKIKNSNGVIDVLALYNEKFSKSLTADVAICDQEFLQFAGMLIRNVVKYLHNDNTIYSVTHDVNNTPDSEMLCYFLADFVSAYNTYLLNGASIFQSELIKLPNYREVNSWQVSGGWSGGAFPTFAGNSKIVCVPSSGGDPINQEGIIGIIADRRGLGTTSKDIYVATDRFNGDRYTNYTYGATNQYINDLSEQGVVLIMDGSSSSKETKKK